MRSLGDVGLNVEPAGDGGRIGGPDVALRVGAERGDLLHGLVEQRFHPLGAAAVDERFEIPADVLGTGREGGNVGGSHEGGV